MPQDPGLRPQAQCPRPWLHGGRWGAWVCVPGAQSTEGVLMRREESDKSWIGRQIVHKRQDIRISNNPKGMRLEMHVGPLAVMENNYNNRNHGTTRMF